MKRPDGKGSYIIQSEAYRNYEKKCVRFLEEYHGKRFKGPIHAKVLYYMPDRRSWPDLIGLMQATADILQKAKIITNDKNIGNWDGTRLVGVDKNYPRAEIFLEDDIDGDDAHI